MEASTTPHVRLADLEARHAFFERWLRGARTLEIGARDAAESAASLKRRGARSVLSCELGPDLLERLRGEATEPFDLIHLVDGATERLSEFLEAAHGGLSSRGRLVVGWRDPSAPTLAEGPIRPGMALERGPLVAAMQERFSWVRLVGQSPVVAYRFAPDGSGEEASWELDTRLIDGVPSAYVLAICGVGEEPALSDDCLLAMLPIGSAGGAPSAPSVSPRAIGQAILEELRGRAFSPIEAAHATGQLAALLEQVRAEAERRLLEKLVVEGWRPL